MKGRPSDEKLKQNLDYVASSVSLAVNKALTAAVVQFTAFAYFMHLGQEVFRTNPANTLPYSAMHALEDNSVLELYERFIVTRQVTPIDFRNGKELDLLRKHRDLIGHPATFDWGTETKQKFADANSYSPMRCGLVWAIAKRLDGALEAQGSPRRLAMLPVTAEMAESVNLILRLAVKPETASLVPSVEFLVKYLESPRAGIIRILERYPEGSIPEGLGDDEEP